MDDLIELAEYCERATGADLELDGEIAAALRTIKPRGGYIEPISYRAVGDGWVCILDGDGCTVQSEEAPRVTASLDAALALVERVLPVSSVELTIKKTINRAQIDWWPDGERSVKGIYEESEAATPALALVAATLRAVHQKKGGAE